MYAVISDTYMDFRAALACLTVVGSGRCEPASRERLARATLLFPAVGLLIGTLLAAANTFLAPWLPEPVRFGLIVGLLAGLTRGQTVRGLAQSASDRVFRGSEGFIAKATGAAAAGISVVSKILALTATSPALISSSLILAPMLGRWALVVVALGSTPIRRGVGSDFLVGRVTFREFGWASVFALGLTMALSEAIGVLTALIAALGATGLRLLAHRRPGGPTGDSLTGSSEIIEAIVMLSMALISVALVPDA